MTQDDKETIQRVHETANCLWNTDYLYIRTLATRTSIPNTREDLLKELISGSNSNKNQFRITSNSTSRSGSSTSLQNTN